MEYEMMIYPKEFPGFENMTKKQAEEYFKWYISIVDERMAYLQNYIRESGGDVDLDYAPESLKTLWRWYEPKIYLEEIPQEWYEERLAKASEWGKQFIKKEDLSIETKKILYDIATYFGETIRRNHADKLYWDYVKKPKSDVSFNRPAIEGFKVELDPLLISRTCCFKYLRIGDLDVLYKIYLVWEKNIR